MSVDIRTVLVEPTPTAVVAATTTWAEFPSRWRAMLDEVWSFLASAPAGLYKHGHNVMFYKDDVPNVEVGVQVDHSFEGRGAVHASSLPGGMVATARHAGPIDRIGDTHQAIRAWCAANGLRLTGQRWEIYGDPDSLTGHFLVDIFWSVM
jgi:effector-binding domain-containing protein